MSFLSLCQQVARRSGITSTGPASVDNQTGILADIVDWVKLADIDIQLERDDWDFHWKTHSTTLTAGRKTYLQGDFGVNDIQTVSGILINGQEAEYLSWAEYQELYRHTGREDEQGTDPRVVTRAPDGTFYVYPVPLQDSTLVIDYSATPTELSSGTDESVIPSLYEGAIVEKALMYFAEDQDDDMMYMKAQRAYANWLNRMSRSEKQAMRFEWQPE